MADRLLADGTQLVTKVKATELNALQLANGSKALLDEIATGKITGEEERYSHTDLWDFEANFEGSKAAIAQLRPFLEDKDPQLVAAIDASSTAVSYTHLRAHETVLDLVCRLLLEKKTKFKHFIRQWTAS